ncbi:MAG TPA: sulfite exporter TauE/SafE family protein [Thermoleophilaceae bacterium]|nr:sulfite exporter TauE/SafE family protein [Thermoleophilaceae bacterium]
MDLLAGGLVVAAASFLGGVTGFGYSLVATPLLLLLGFDLPFVVTVNLALACITRVSVAYRFRSDARPTRAAGLIVGSIPGLWLGALVLTTVDDSTVKLCAGLIVMTAAVLLWRAVTQPPPRELPGAPVAAGFAGGFLGAATSLNGVAPVLLLARDKAAPRSVLADLALYFVASNAIGLVVLAATGALESDALYPAFLLWLPGSLAANWTGTVIGPSLPETAFRRLTLAVVFAAGAVTVVTA